MLKRVVFFISVALPGGALAQNAPPPPPPPREQPQEAPAANTPSQSDAESTDGQAGSAATPDPPNATTPTPRRNASDDIEDDDAPPTLDQEFGSDSDVISLSDWEDSAWSLLKPRLSLAEIDGYFRMRGNLMRRMDFGNQTVPAYAQTSGSASDPKADFSFTNVRLRMEPTINVLDGVSVVTTIDILDNVIMGSTPNSLQTQTGATPLNILNNGQTTPQRGENALTDSIVVKRAYANVTALNEQLKLSFGRMPNHWGLGMFANSGDCLDCNYGDVADRVALSFKAANHVFTPMFDWASSGPQVDPFGPGGQPFDAVTWDDVEQYSLRVSKMDHRADIKKRVLQGDTVVNYGFWGMWRKQSRDLSAPYYDPAGTGELSYDPEGPASLAYEERRNATLLAGDVYARIFTGGLKLSLEAALVWANFRDRNVQQTTFGTGGTSTTTNDPRTTKLLQWGAAFELAYHFDGDAIGTILELKGGAASGDSAPGMGALGDTDSQRGFFPGSDRPDLRLSNFQFHPDYQIDLLMFRHVIGTVTDAWYAHPEITYLFDERVAGSLGATYAQALFNRSTASCASTDDSRCRSVPSPDSGRSLGLEFDAELSYGMHLDQSENAFRAAIMGGVLFPFAAFKNLNREPNDQGGSFAWTIMSRLYVTF